MIVCDCMPYLATAVYLNLILGKSLQGRNMGGGVAPSARFMSATHPLRDGCFALLLRPLRSKSQFSQPGTEPAHGIPGERAPLPGVGQVAALLHVAPDFSVTCSNQLVIEVLIGYHGDFSSLVSACFSCLFQVYSDKRIESVLIRTKFRQKGNLLCTIPRRAYSPCSSCCNR